MRALLLALVLIGVAVRPGSGARSGGDGDLLARLTDNVHEAARSGGPFLFRVIRVHAEANGGGANRVFGTGIAVGTGRIMTTAGVVGPAAEVLVHRAGSDTLRARVVGVDRRTDVALLEVDGLDHPPIPVAEPSIRFPGEAVVALGLGRQPAPTASFGVVVLAGGPRLGLTDTDVLQVSAPAFPGMTGGALVNLEGELVGLISGRMALDPATAVLPAGASLMAGFLGDGVLTSVAPTSALIALPAGHALAIARELGERGRVERGYLGLQVELVQAKRTRTRPLPGVMVERVVPGSPAESAGLLPGDVILEYASAKVRSPENLSYLVAATVPGSEVPLRFLRRGVSTVCSVRIAQAPEPAWNPAFDEAVPGGAATAGVAPSVR